MIYLREVTLCYRDEFETRSEISTKEDYNLKVLDLINSFLIALITNIFETHFESIFTMGFL